MENKTCESCAWLNEDTTEELRFCEELGIYVDPDELSCKCYTMKLTKQQAIEGHRKMWNWIADEIEKRKCECDISFLKQCYCYENNLSLMANCFCCQYNKCCPRCAKCPLDWIETPHCCDNNSSLYHRVLWSDSWQEQADLARQISNLPENEDVE